MECCEMQRRSSVVSAVSIFRIDMRPRRDQKIDDNSIVRSQMQRCNPITSCIDVRPGGQEQLDGGYIPGPSSFM